MVTVHQGNVESMGSMGRARNIRMIEGVALRWVEWTESKIVWPENGSFRTIGSIQ